MGGRVIPKRRKDGAGLDSEMNIGGFGSGQHGAGPSHKLPQVRKTQYPPPGPRPGSLGCSAKQGPSSLLRCASAGRGGDVIGMPGMGERASTKGASNVQHLQHGHRQFASSLSPRESSPTPAHPPGPRSLALRLRKAQRRTMSFLYGMRLSGVKLYRRDPSWAISLLNRVTGGRNLDPWFETLQSWNAVTPDKADKQS